MYKGYVIPLAAIGPVAYLFFFSFVGITKPYEGIYYLPLGVSIFQAIAYYVLTLLGVYVVALFIDYTAPRFHGKKSYSGF